MFRGPTSFDHPENADISAAVRLNQPTNKSTHRERGIETSHFRDRHLQEERSFSTDPCEVNRKYDVAKVEHSERSARNLFGFLEDFYPLSCNEFIDTVDCDPGSGMALSLSSLINSSLSSEEEVVVPCGECAYWDLPSGTNVVTNAPGGLNVLGKLHVPPSASGTLRTPNLYVQGVLHIEPPKLANTIKILLHGVKSRFFVPHQDNEEACDITGCDVGKKPIVVAGGRLDISGLPDPDNCPSWVKLQNVVPNPSDGGIDQIIVGTDAASCWNIGEEILLTSPDVQQTWRETAIIHSVEAQSGSIVLTKPIHKAFAEATVIANSDRPYFAVEVANLSRRIIFEAEKDDGTNDGLIGGHLKILRTPNIKQKLEGVLIRNFGQQGNMGRYPIHFHLCGDISGSIVSKNVIRQSNQRCVVIHGTDNAYIYENVAFEAHGHCYFTEDGIEIGNVFERNLGADIKFPSHLIPGENDDEPSVFWITNANNTWIENVAAGSDSSGFWFDTRETVRGVSYTGNENYHPQSVSIATFRGNTAHSIHRRGIQLYAPGWRPILESVVEDNYLYRIGWAGWFIHGNQNIAIIGGAVSDCGIGLQNFRSSNIRLEGIDIIGFSEHYARVLAETNSSWYCMGSKRSSITGMQLHPWRNLHTTASMGTVAHNLTFSRFGTTETGCEGMHMAAITMSIDQVVDFYDTPNRVSGLNFLGNMKRLEVCSADAKGIDNMIIEDVDGSLGPTGNPGFFVSDYEAMTTFASARNESGGTTGCIPVADTCNLAFCEKTCLRQATLVTNNAFSTKNIEMVISDGSNTTVTDAWHHVSYFDTPFHHTRQDRDSKYGATLPTSGKFTVSFRDVVTGLPAWPDYVEVDYEESPLCDNGSIASWINLVKPQPTDDRCSNLIKNGNLDDGIYDAWQQGGGTLGLISPGARNSSRALHVTNREEGFVSQWIDVSCLVATTTYTFSAEIRLESQDSGSQVTCSHSLGNCPKAQIVLYSWDAATETKTETFRPLVNSSSIQKIDDWWYQMTGTTEFSSQDIDASRVQIRVEPPTGVNFAIDNVEMKKS